MASISGDRDCSVRTSQARLARSLGGTRRGQPARTKGFCSGGRAPWPWPGGHRAALVPAALPVSTATFSGAFHHAGRHLTRLRGFSPLPAKGYVEN